MGQTQFRWLQPSTPQSRATRTGFVRQLPATRRFAKFPFHRARAAICGNPAALRNDKADFRDNAVKFRDNGVRIQNDAVLQNPSPSFIIVWRAHETPALPRNHHSQLPRGAAQPGLAAGGGTRNPRNNGGKPSGTNFLLFISTTVLKEVRRGDPVHAAAREAWLAGIPLLGDLPEASELAKRLLRDEIIPTVAADDATHVALAAAHQMDFLLTWNCTHINNHNIRARIQRACAAMGLVCSGHLHAGGIDETISHERKRNPRTNSSRSRGTRAGMQLRRGRHLR